MTHREFEQKLLETLDLPMKGITDLKLYCKVGELPTVEVTYFINGIDLRTVSMYRGVDKWVEVQ